MRPLNIFDDKDQELLLCELFESFAELAGAILETSDARCSHSRIFVLIRRRGAVAKCLQNRVVRFFFAHPFDTMSVSHACLGSAAEGMDERSLSDAGLSGDEDDLTLTGCSLEDHGLQAQDFVITADEFY